jgi:hypothetical protein
MKDAKRPRGGVISVTVSSPGSIFTTPELEPGWKKDDLPAEAGARDGFQVEPELLGVVDGVGLTAERVVGWFAEPTIEPVIADLAGGADELGLVVAIRVVG